MLQSMRFLAGISCVPMLCLALTPSFASAQDKADEAVPLKKLVLFNSGVGYFEHSGNVEGDASVDLKFNVDDVNDLLKSMVTQDLGGGRISTVTYGSRDPITRTLKTFAIDLTTSPTIAELLIQIRGEKVEVESPNKVTGTILGVEKRKRKVDDEVIEYDVLNLVTATGLKSVSLEQVSSIKLLNEKLDAELRQALLILATGNSTDKKTVSLKFLGEGKRPVRIGYIQETPVWKTSYRLVLSDEGQPQLQGWAIVENQTESDWSNVNLKLVSGRPISFRMDLYQPLYVGRPMVVPELFASLQSRLYDQDLASHDNEFQALAEKSKAKESRKKLMANADFARRAPGKSRAPAAYAADRKRAMSDDMDIMASVKSAASAADVGELFQYEIEQPVTLARQESAMLPIVNAEVKGEKVSVHPFLAY